MTTASEAVEAAAIEIDCHTGFALSPPELVEIITRHLGPHMGGREDDATDIDAEWLIAVGFKRTVGGYSLRVSGKERIVIGRWAGFASSPLWCRVDDNQSFDMRTRGQLRGLFAALQITINEKD